MHDLKLKPSNTSINETSTLKNTSDAVISMDEPVQEQLNQSINWSYHGKIAAGLIGTGLMVSGGYLFAHSLQGMSRGDPRDLERVGGTVMFLAGVLSIVVPIIMAVSDAVKLQSLSASTR